MATSDINIGTGANLSGSNLYIGHKGSTVSAQAVKINTSTGTAGSTTIESTTSATNIGGSLTVTEALTADGGITLPSGDTITLTGNINGAGNITTSGTITTPILTSTAGLSIGTSGATSITIGGSSTPTTVGSTLSVNGLLTSSGGTTITSGQTLKVNTTDSTAIGSSMTIGGTIVTSNDISIGTNCLIKLKSPSTANPYSAVTTQAASTTTIYGNFMYASVTSGSDYQIPTNINCDYYTVGTGGSAFTIYLPPVLIHQIIHIRNQKSTFINITINTASSTTRIYPAITGGGAYSTYALQANIALTLYCDGTHWHGFY